MKGNHLYVAIAIFVAIVSLYIIEDIYTNDGYVTFAWFPFAEPRDPNLSAFDLGDLLDNLPTITEQTLTWIAEQYTECMANLKYLTQKIKDEENLLAERRKYQQDMLGEISQCFYDESRREQVLYTCPDDALCNERTEGLAIRNCLCERTDKTKRAADPTQTFTWKQPGQWEGFYSQTADEPSMTRRLKTGPDCSIGMQQEYVNMLCSDASIRRESEINFGNSRCECSRASGGGYEVFSRQPLSPPSGYLLGHVGPVKLNANNLVTHTSQLPATDPRRSFKRSYFCPPIGMAHDGIGGRALGTACIGDGPDEITGQGSNVGNIWGTAGIFNCECAAGQMMGPDRDPKTAWTLTDKEPSTSILRHGFRRLTFESFPLESTLMTNPKLCDDSRYLCETDPSGNHDCNAGCGAILGRRNSGIA